MNDCSARLLVIIFFLLDIGSSFASDESLVYQATKVGGFAFISIVIVLVYLIRREISKDRVFNLHSIGHKSFYYRNMVTSEEHVSYSLKNLLGMKENENVISSITNRLIFDDRQRFSDLYSHLMSISNSHCDVCELDQSIKLELDGAISPVEARYLSCHSLVLKDLSGFTYGFFIFFEDVTSDKNHFEKINQENLALNDDLALKNNLISLLPCPVWMRDNNLKIVYFNEEFKKMISYERDKELDYGNLEIDKQSWILASKAQEKGCVESEERHVIIDGQRYLYQFFEVPIMNNRAMLGMAYDVTSKDRVRSELDLHVAAQSKLLESTASAIAIYGADTKLKFFNQAFVKLWSFDDHWLLSHPTYGQVLEKLRENRKLPEQVDFKKFKDDQIALFTDLTSTHNDFLCLPDGRYLRVIVIQHALGGLLFSYEDMTYRFELERSFKTLSAVQKETIDNLNDGITVFSENGKLELSNNKFLEMWNCKKNFVESKPHVSKLLSKMQQSINSSIDWDSLRDQFMIKIFSRVTSSIGIELTNGSIIDVLFVPLSDGGTLISYHDITDSILVAKNLLDKDKQSTQRSFIS